MDGWIEPHTYTLQAVVSSTVKSAIVSITVPLVVPAPLAPTSLAVTNRTTNSISLSWLDPNNPTYNPVTGYQVFISTDGIVWTLKGTTALNTLSFTATGLNGATAYSFMVKAVYGSPVTLYSPASNIVNTTTR